MWGHRAQQTSPNKMAQWFPGKGGISDFSFLFFFFFNFPGPSKLINLRYFPKFEQRTWGDFYHPCPTLLRCSNSLQCLANSFSEIIELQHLKIQDNKRKPKRGGKNQKQIKTNKKPKKKTNKNPQAPVLAKTRFLDSKLPALAVGWVRRGGGTPSLNSMLPYFFSQLVEIHYYVVTSTVRTVASLTQVLPRHRC